MYSTLCHITVILSTNIVPIVLIGTYDLQELGQTEPQFHRQLHRAVSGGPDQIAVPLPQQVVVEFFLGRFLHSNGATHIE